MTLRFSNELSLLTTIPEFCSSYTGVFTATLCDLFLRWINKTINFVTIKAVLNV